MKLISLLVITAASLCAQTTITGSILDASGQPDNCVFLAHKSNVQGVGASVIGYVATGGDMNGSAGGYGYSIAPGGISRHAPFVLAAGIYNMQVSCNGLFGSQNVIVRVPPGGSIPIAQLLKGRGRSISQLTGSFSTLVGTLSQQ